MSHCWAKHMSGKYWYGSSIFDIVRGVSSSIIAACTTPYPVVLGLFCLFGPHNHVEYKLPCNKAKRNFADEFYMCSNITR